MLLYLTSGGRSVSEHVSEGGDDINGEANEKRTDGGIDGTEKGEDNS